MSPTSLILVTFLVSILVEVRGSLDQVVIESIIRLSFFETRGTHVTMHFVKVTQGEGLYIRHRTLDQDLGRLSLGVYTKSNMVVLSP